MAFGSPRSFHKKFKFVVEIDHVAFAGFQKCSELSIEVAKVEYYEGGTLIPNKSPGRATVADVTLERGACADKDLFSWLKQVVDLTLDGGGSTGAQGAGLVDPDFRRNFDIVQLDRDGEELRRWTVFGAWPTKFVAGDWDNNSDETVIESVTLAIDKFDLTFG